MSQPRHGRWWTVGAYFGLVSDSPKPVRYSRKWWLMAAVYAAFGALTPLIVSLLDRYT